MGILDNAKEVAKAVQEIHNLELYQRVLSLHSDIIALVEDNLRLRSENQTLQSALDLRAKMTFKPPFYYQVGDATPHCPACLEDHRKAIHVVFAFDNGEDARWDCPSCKHMYMLRGNPANKRSHHFDPGGGGPDSWMGR